MYKHILVPTDGSPLSLKAAKEAATLAKSLGAKVTAVYVTADFYPPVYADSVRRIDLVALQETYRKSSAAVAAKALDKVEAVVAAAKVACEKVQLVDDQPWNAIIGAARKRKCDLVVMASHGRGALAGLLIGSETTKVLAHSKLPVLVCR